MRFRLIRCAFTVLFAWGACWASDTGRVSKVIDGDTLKVALPRGVETIRLIGVDAPERVHSQATVEQLGQEAAAFTRRLAFDKVVRLERDPEGDTRDRYGRLLRYVYLPDGTLLNAEIISQGFANALTGFPFSRLDEFKALEREARVAERGLWRSGSVLTLTATEARGHIGRFAKVCGAVASARYVKRTRGKPTFLNLGRPYPNQVFTIVIWGTDRETFDEPETTYLGKNICVTGQIESYRGEPQIIGRDPSQLSVEASSPRP